MYRPRCIGSASAVIRNAPKPRWLAVASSRKNSLSPGLLVSHPFRCLSRAKLSEIRPSRVGVGGAGTTPARAGGYAKFASPSGFRARVGHRGGRIRRNALLDQRRDDNLRRSVVVDGHGRECFARGVLGRFCWAVREYCGPQHVDRRCLWSCCHVGCVGRQRVRPGLPVRWVSVGVSRLFAGRVSAGGPVGERVWCLRHFVSHPSGQRSASSHCHSPRSCPPRH